jgi:hypothetical protein
MNDQLECQEAARLPAYSRDYRSTTRQSNAPDSVWRPAALQIRSATEPDALLVERVQSREAKKQWR